jgi:hypothetical protein
MNNNYYLRLGSLLYTSNLAYVGFTCYPCIKIACISAIHIPQNVG